VSQLFNLKWFAGFFDGEGSVTLALGRYINKQGFRNPRLLVRISQNNTRILGLIKRRFKGGYISPDKHISFEYGNAERLLRKILPHLVVKKKAAELGLKHRELLNQKRVGGKGAGKGTPYSKAWQRKQMNLRKKLMRLNAKD